MRSAITIIINAVVCRMSVERDDKQLCSCNLSVAGGVCAQEEFVSTRRGSARVLKRAEPLDGVMALRKLRVEQRRVCEESQSSFGRLQVWAFLSVVARLVPAPKTKWMPSACRLLRASL